MTARRSHDEPDLDEIERTRQGEIERTRQGEIRPGNQSEIDRIYHRNPGVAAREGEVPVEPTPQEVELAKLQAYRDKMLSDLDREESEAHAVHDATEARCAQIAAQRAHVLAEYEEKAAAIMAPPPPPPVA